jgi:histidine triad (HIT) family protein
MESCIFCKIANKEVEKEFLFENERIVAFEDISPKAPLHLLIVPKKHIPSLDQIGEEDKELMGEMILVAQKLAREKGVVERGYRLILNTGRDAGQTVDHLHLHLLGGAKLPFA